MVSCLVFRVSGYRVWGLQVRGKGLGCVVKFSVMV